jgi:hypothetical protein
MSAPILTAGGGGHWLLAAGATKVLAPVRAIKFLASCSALECDGRPAAELARVVDLPDSEASPVTARLREHVSRSLCTPAAS